jgi:hypothetical protein
MSTENASTAAYVPETGDRVTVRRWVKPAGRDERRDEIEQTGVITGTFPAADGHYIDLDGSADRIFTGAQWVGDGHLLTEVTLIEPARPELYRQQVTPDMSVTADGSTVVLEISDGLAGHVLRRVALSNLTEFWDVLLEARTANGLHQAEAEERRREGLGEARRARGQLTRPEAVDWLIGKGYGRGLAVNVTGRLRGEGGSVLGMTYDSQYWRVPGGDALVKEG